MFYTKMALTKSIALLCAIVLLSSSTEAFALNRTYGGRIVGGEAVDIKYAPYQASVLHFGRHICGGVILTRNFILTAAHCFVFVYHVDEVQVRVGSSESYHGGLVYDAEFYALHPDYPEDHQETTDYDVALIKLAYPLALDKKIQPISMVESDFEPKTGTKALVSGWGRLEYQGVMPDSLQRAEVEISDIMDCMLVYLHKAPITERQLCAGTENADRDACTGDSGGPLVIDGMLAGVVSWGEKCAEPGYPGVYSNVAEYRDWIMDIIQYES